ARGCDWTPDGKAIVTTHQGKIWRIDAASGERTAVPFKAAVEQRVTASWRLPHAVDSPTVRARILRWPVESPDGKRLVFSAVGHLYEQDLPQGTPKRLTSGTDLEYSPAFSPDGQSIAYVTWNDKEGGQVWVLPSGGAPRRVTQ